MGKRKPNTGAVATANRRRGNPSGANAARHAGAGQERSQQDAVPTVEDILRGTSHALRIFKAEAVKALKPYLKRGKPYLKCFATGKERPGKPEEIVRQLYVKMLMDDYR